MTISKRECWTNKDNDLSVQKTFRILPVISPLSDVYIIFRVNTLNKNVKYHLILFNFKNIALALKKHTVIIPLKFDTILQ